MKEPSKLTKFLIFSFSILIIYTIVEFIVSTKTGITHDTLTTSVFFAFGGVETFGCAIIKVFKLKGENNDERDNISDS